MSDDPDFKTFITLMSGLLLFFGIFCLCTWYDVQLKREHEFRMEQLKCSSLTNSSKEVGE